MSAPVHFLPLARVQVRAARAGETARCGREFAAQHYLPEAPLAGDRGWQVAECDGQWVADRATRQPTREALRRTEAAAESPLRCEVDQLRRRGDIEPPENLAPVPLHRALVQAQPGADLGVLEAEPDKR